MKTKLFTTGMLLIATTFARAATNDLTSALQKGLFEEEANHNLDAAAQAYQAVSAQFDKDRKLAATAIFRLGEVYRKQGRTDEATAQYERIVREFSDQQTLATLSRQNLVGMGEKREAPVSSPLTRAARLKQKELLEQEIKLVEQDLAELRKQLEAGVVSQTEVRAKEREVLKLQQQVAALKVDDTDLAAGASAATLQEEITTTERELEFFERNKKENPNVLPSLLASKDDELKNLLHIRGEKERRLAALKQNYTAEHPEVKAVQAELDSTTKAINDRADGILIGYRNRLEVLRALLVQVGLQPAPVSAVTDDEEKEIRRLQAMIQNSPDLINAKGADGETPVASAAARGQLKVVQFLLDHGADIQGQSSALNLAAFNGHKAMVELLLDHGADVNAQDSSGRTPIHPAAENGFQSVVATLLARKADVNAQTKKQETSLLLAATKGHSAMVDLLIAKGAQLDAKDERGWTALTAAALLGHTLVVKRLLDARADPNILDSTGRTALSHAVQRGHTDVVKVLLEGKADPNAGSADSPLLLAVRAENAALTELLLRAGADPNQATDCQQVYMSRQSGSTTRQSNANRVKRTPLQAAVLEEYPAMAKLLLQFKGDAKAKYESGYPLVLGAVNNPEILKAMLEAGADANASYGKEQRALIMAAMNANSAAVELLVNHGANANVRDDQGRTPLDISAERADKKSVEWLLKAKADANAVITNSLLTALHRAVYIGSGEIAEMLLAHGANPNLKDNTGNTPLHWALGIGSRGVSAQEMVELLLSKGADPNLRNNDGLTALDLAKGRTGSPQPGFVGLAALPPPGIPPRTVRQPAVSTSPAKTEPIDIATLLREHGARDDLPKLDRIEVQRPSANYSATVFWKGNQDWNRFTILELIAVEYGLLTSRNAKQMAYSFLNPLPVKNERDLSSPLTFPDLGRVTIHRPTADGTSRKTIEIDVAAILQSGDCSKDVALNWGDVVEISEADHRIDERWPGFSGEALKTFVKCLARKIVISVKDQTVPLTLSPAVSFAEGKPNELVSNRPFGLLPVLQESKLLRASSDSSRVKVTRRDLATGKSHEWVVDCSNPAATPYFWLRDGDVIEVPDKP